MAKLLACPWRHPQWGRKGGTTPRRREVLTISQVLSSLQCIYYQKTLGSNMATPNLFLAPSAIQPRYAPGNTCLYKWSMVAPSATNLIRWLSKAVSRSGSNLTIRQLCYYCTLVIIRSVSNLPLKSYFPNLLLPVIFTFSLIVWFRGSARNSINNKQKGYR